MIWVLVWFQISNSTGVEYYQLSTHLKQEECLAALEQAKVLVQTKDTDVACLKVKGI